ncbi:MAG: ribonuclease J [Pseudomonadota bacterium]
MTPDSEDLWFLPLGGCGEIGMNLNLYGHDGRWLMVDCGVTFSRDNRIEMPDPAFITARREALSALLLTHAHQDHIGAVAWLWPKLKCPVYATPFAAALLRQQLAERGLADRVPITEVSPGHRHTVDGFDIEWLGITHSTAECNALMIRTPAGSVFHTGDWKLDPGPVVGEALVGSRFEALGEEDVLAMVCDSTNAMVRGWTPSESALRKPLRAAIEAAPGRVIVACFGSNVARLATLRDVAEATGRYIGLLGRSLHGYLSAARCAGLWRETPHLIDASHLGYLPPQEVLAVATGSQGEPRAALQRLADDSHPHLTLAPGDTVLMSSRVIPGNEAAVEGLLMRLRDLGVNTITDIDRANPIHASGHPAQDELRQMYGWVQPRTAIPVHGEEAHMAANAQIARQCGVEQQMTGLNGDLFLLAPQRAIRRGAVPTGRLRPG